MKHYTHFVKQGAKRLKTTGDFSSNGVAFMNPDGEIVIVVGNLFDRVREFTFEYQGQSMSVTLEKDSFHTICLK